MAEANARAEHERARSDLARALGMHPDSLPPVAAVVALDALPPSPPTDAAVQRALAARADLRALRHASEESSHRRVGERRGMVSELQFVAGYKQTTGTNTGVVGVIVPLPLFNRNEGARERARGEATLAEAELRDAELRVRGEVVAALRGYEAIREAMREGASGVDARAAEVARIAEGAYREGAISLVELVEAQRARAESRAAALRWAVDARLAVLDINRATGAPILDTLESQ
jgi:cobalt-zinc-cadmium efflux system outer membrane protein